MAQNPRQTLSIKQKKSQYGTMFQSPKPIETIEQKFFSEIVRILQELSGKTLTDFNERFRVQKTLMKVINEIYNEIQIQFPRSLCQKIFDDLIQKITRQVSKQPDLNPVHFENALKGFKPCTQPQAEAPKVSYKA